MVLLQIIFFITIFLISIYYRNTISKFFTQERRFILYELLIFYSLVLILFQWNPMGISKNYPIACYLFLLFMFFIFLIYFLYLKKYYFKFSDLSNFLFNEPYEKREIPNFGKLFKNFSTFVVTILTIAAAIITIIYIIKRIPNADSFIAFFISSMIFIGFILVILYLIKDVFKSEKKDKLFFKKNNEFLEKIVKLYTNYIKPFVNIDFAEQYNLTKEPKFKPIWNIIIAEVILVGSYFALPYLFEVIMSHDGIKLLEDPVYLNNEQTLGDETLHSKFSEKNEHNYHYSVSAWFNLNPQPPNTNENNNKYTNILNYGNKPKISFNISTNSLRIETEIKNKELTEIFLSKDIPYQKWNNIVINYDGGYMDVFFNGDLVASKSNIAPFMTYENIIIGQKNGLEGGVRNVTFFNRILTKGEIKYGYNIYKK